MSSKHPQPSYPSTAPPNYAHQPPAQQHPQPNHNPAHHYPAQQQYNPNMGAASAIIVVFVTILFPPAGAFLVAGCGVDLLINILLTCLGYVIYSSVRAGKGGRRRGGQGEALEEGRGRGEGRERYGRVRYPRSRGSNAPLVHRSLSSKLSSYTK